MSNAFVSFPKRYFSRVKFSFAYSHIFPILSLKAANLDVNPTGYMLFGIPTGLIIFLIMYLILFVILFACVSYGCKHRACRNGS